MGQWNKTEQHVKRDNETELALCVCVCGILEEGPHEEAGEFKRTSPCLKQQRQTEHWTKTA
jgi:hypothetical protein